MLSIAADERAALHFDDMASALDAGLPLQALGGRGPKDERVVHEALRMRGVVLSSTEDLMLLAAWRAGRMGAALRSRAVQRRERAEFQRTIWAGMRYPLVLFTMVVIASLVTAPVIGHYWFAIGVLVGLAAAVALAFAAHKGLRSGNEAWSRLPVIGAIATSLAELPYLETLHSMYGAGVPLLQAHTAAIATVPVASVQQRLRIADTVLQGGRSLTDALAQALALQPETRTLIATGEQAGQLEDALQRALTRRRDMASRAVADAARRGSAIVYGLAMLTAVVIIVSFYLGLNSKLSAAMGKH